MRKKVAVVGDRDSVRINTNVEKAVGANIL